MTVAAVLDLAGKDGAADIAVATGLASMAASAVTGAADAVDTYGTGRRSRDRPRDADGDGAPALPGSSLLRLGPRGLPAAGAAAVVRRLRGDEPPARTSVATCLPAGQPGRPPRVRLARRRSGRRSTSPRCRRARWSRRRRRPTRSSCIARRTTTRSPRCSRCARTRAGRWTRATIVDGCVECPWHGSQFGLADGHVTRAARPSTTSRCSRSARRRTAGSRHDAPSTRTDGRPPTGQGSSTRSRRPVSASDHACAPSRTMPDRIAGQRRGRAGHERQRVEPQDVRPPRDPHRVVAGDQLAERPPVHAQRDDRRCSLVRRPVDRVTVPSTPWLTT